MTPGVKRTGSNGAFMRQRHAEHFSAGDIPESSFAVAARRQNRPPVRTEGSRQDSALMHQGLTKRLARGCIPQPRCPVLTPGDDRAAVGTKSDAANRSLMRPELPQAPV